MIRYSEERVENLARLAKAGRGDLYIMLMTVYRLLVDRKVTQAALQHELGWSRKTLESTLLARPSVSLETLERRLDEIDCAIGSLSDG